MKVIVFLDFVVAMVEALVVQELQDGKRGGSGGGCWCQVIEAGGNGSDLTRLRWWCSNNSKQPYPGGGGGGASARWRKMEHR